jgi:hypothetical protein
MPSSAATISITEPKLFRARAVAIVHGYGVLLGVPFVAAVFLVSLMKFGLATALIPLLALAVTAYLLPFGFGNPHVIRLARSIAPAAGDATDGVVVQLTLFPRIRTGIRALLEDADDIGCLSFTGEELVYRGDSVQLRLPFESIERVQPRNVGLRVPFIYGWRIRLRAVGLPGVEWLEFAERSSCVLSTSWAVTRRLNARLAAAVPRAAGP